MPALNSAKAMVKDIIEMGPSNTYPGCHKFSPIPSEHVSHGFPNSQHANRDSSRHPTHTTQHPQHSNVPQISYYIQYFSAQSFLEYAPSQPYLRGRRKGGRV